MKYKIEIDEYKTIRYFYKNKLHRENDLPAVMHIEGNIFYYKNGGLHRDGDNPNVIYSDGYKQYWKNGIKIK